MAATAQWQWNLIALSLCPRRKTLSTLLLVADSLHQVITSRAASSANADLAINVPAG